MSDDDAAFQMCAERSGAILFHRMVLMSFQLEDEEHAWNEDILFSTWWELTRHVRENKGFTQKDMHEMLDVILKDRPDSDEKIEAVRDGLIVDLPTKLD